MSNLVRILSVLCFMLAATTASAKPVYFQLFKTTYPDATAIQKCTVCHTKPPQLNPYGLDFSNHNHDLKAIEDLDSDGDGAKNIDEIKAQTFHGDKDSKPAQAEE